MVIYLGVKSTSWVVFLLEECGEEREIDELHEVWRHEAGRWIVT